MVRSTRGPVMLAAVTVTVVVVAVAATAAVVASAGTSPSQCKLERNQLINACRPVLIWLSPSADCCQRVRVINIECVCPYVSPKTASIVRPLGIRNVVKKIERCGRTVPQNFKCGSITTP